GGDLAEPDARRRSLGAVRTIALEMIVVRAPALDDGAREILASHDFSSNGWPARPPPERSWPGRLTACGHAADEEARDKNGGREYTGNLRACQHLTAAISECRLSESSAHWVCGMRCKPWRSRNRDLYPQDRFKIRLDAGTGTCPARVITPIRSGGCRMR